MRRVRFGDFRKGNYEPAAVNDFEQLYILRDGDSVLYIGITGIGIWNRWFDPLMGHLGNNRSTIARQVKRNAPGSDDWTIELWTARDCTKFLGLKKFWEGRIKDYEMMMIHQLQPRFNVMHNRRTDSEAEESEDAVADMYDEFGEE